MDKSSIVEFMELQKKILITGFEAFADYEHNPTQRLIEDLSQLHLSHIETLLLPVSYKQAFAKLKEALDEQQVDYVICTGLAYNREVINIERIAINCESAHIADNDMDMALERPIVFNGREAFFSTLPIVEIVEHLNQKGFEAKISNTAGTYVCNSLMYQLLDYIANKSTVGREASLVSNSAPRQRPDLEKNRTPIRAGFIHYPPSTLNFEKSQWPPQRILQATLEILKCCEKEI
ncbi:MAG: hypothetical protein M9899_01555 [Bdellovibrionaceae bacterium]|nr:hypothetical protein [Pseudobdellovibrionaceae bacterium]